MKALISERANTDANVSDRDARTLSSLNKHAMNRRSFITLATMGAVSLPLRAATGRDAISFLVVTDTHLGYKDQDKAEQLWLKTAAAMAKQSGEFILHLGDIVDGGREALYARYLEGRKLIGRPVHEIPGNHDPEELFVRHIRPQINHVIEHGWLRLLLLNNSRRDSHEGFLTPEQIAWLSSECDTAAAKDQLVVIAMHVPAHANQHPDRGWFIKPANGQTALYELLKKHESRVLALFHGHFHNGLRGWDDHAPVHEVCFPSALYNQDRQLEAQHAPGYNPPEFRPGFTAVTITSHSIDLRFHTVDAGEVLKKGLQTAPA